MQNILTREILGFRRTGDIGIEIEVESLDGQTAACTEPWDIKIDESLRHHGFEYYTTRPIRCDSTKVSIIKNLTNSLQKCKLVWDSPRTSVHVHINILEHTPLQVWTAATTYWLLDNLLIQYCGEDERRGNVFCLRMKDSEGVIKSVLRDMESPVTFSTLRNDHIRYSSQNVNAIPKFGSLEYRGMRGTIDPDLIDKWTTEMYNIVHKSKRWQSPSDMLDTYISSNLGEFLSQIFSRKFTEELLKLSNAEKSVRDNLGMLCEICYAYDWAKWQTRVNKNHVPPPKRDLETLTYMPLNLETPAQTQFNTRYREITRALYQAEGQQLIND